MSEQSRSQRPRSFWSATGMKRIVPEVPPVPLDIAMRTLGTSHACAEVSNITAHAHNGFLSLTAPLGKKIGRD